MSWLYEGGTVSYDALQAQAYDASYGRHPSISEAVGYAAIRADDVVVDVGCGSGHALCLAHDIGAVVIGVDPSAAMLALARSRAESRSMRLSLIHI